MNFTEKSFISIGYAILFDIWKVSNLKRLLCTVKGCFSPEI